MEDMHITRRTIIIALAGLVCVMAAFIFNGLGGGSIHDAASLRQDLLRLPVVVGLTIAGFSLVLARLYLLARRQKNAIHKAELAGDTARAEFLKEQYRTLFK
jgi:Flp pilus assembly protein protease CpaA